MLTTLEIGIVSNPNTPVSDILITMVLIVCVSVNAYS